MYYEWRPYVPVATRRRQAAQAMAKLRKKGHPVSPVVIQGRTIARTFWGKAWGDNLERYSDYANRLPRGRTYVRNGSVVDLQIAAGEVQAMVSGSALYRVAVRVAPLQTAHWGAICQDCAGAIDSLVELLQGRFSTGVMERMCEPRTGLFPAPKEIGLSCTCPDWASMCKHVAAVLYGIGARLDERPELLFTLRAVDGQDLISRAATDLPLARSGPAAEKVLDGSDLSELFGLEMAGDAERTPAPSTASAKRRLGKTPAGKPKPPGRRGKAPTGARARTRTTPPPSAAAKKKVRPPTQKKK